MTEPVEGSTEAATVLRTEQEFQPVDLSALFEEQTLLHDNPEIGEATVALHQALTDTSVDTERVRQAWTEYGKVVETVVESLQATAENPDVREKTQIAAIIHKALIFLSAGKIIRYLEELDVADVQAFSEGFDDISTALSDEIHSQVEQLEITPETFVLRLRGILEEANRERLKDLVLEGDDMNDLLGSAYGMLLEEGEDPDEVWARIGITEG